MSPRQITKEEEGRIYAVKTYILNHLHERLTTKKLARKAAMGEQKFKDGFWRLFEKSVGSYMLCTRMETGRFLLGHTDKSVKEIGAVCGYSKTRNFSSAYRKYFKVSPSEERLNSREL